MKRTDLFQEREGILQSVYWRMWELKTHEIIENVFIMNKLQERLRILEVIGGLIEKQYYLSESLSGLGSRSRLTKNQEPEPETLGKKSQEPEQEPLRN